jgi:hypothetical protein
MNSTMLKSAFGAASVITDVNGDGVNDVVKQTALNAPQHVAIVYNNPNAQGMFNIYDDFMNSSPYHVNTGDLNNDSRVDLVVSSDGADRYRYNMGNDTFGRVIWGANKTFKFLSGGDDGFASNNIVTDLDGDGWSDAIFCDVDVDIGGTTAESTSTTTRAAPWAPRSHCARSVRAPAVGGWARLA